MHKDPLKHIEELTEQVHLLSEKRATSAFTRYPFLFSLLVTFGFVAVVDGFGGITASIPYLSDRPWLVLVIGLVVLLFTGSLYRKLSK